MARRPIEHERPGGGTVREALWAAMREKGVFTCADIKYHVRFDVDTATVRTYAQSLVAAGHVTRCDGPPIVYHVRERAPVEAPRINRDGEEVVMGRGNEQMWGTLRRMFKANHCTPAELAAHASSSQHSISVATAEQYLRTLLKAGYVRCLAGRGRGALFYYALIRDTGPKPPMIQRTKRLYDPNLNKVVWEQEQPHE